MLEKARANFRAAAADNAWFDPRFIELREGDALSLPVDDGTIDFAAENCLFNIFTREHLSRALAEMHRGSAASARARRPLGDGVDVSLPRRGVLLT